jgi:delta 1-pyrroline-5-carboxylate dehydrogenase
MKLMRDETFGPVIAIQKVRDEAEALKLANDSCYGLSASVWSKDKAGAMNIARRIEAGAVCVNDHMVHMMIPEVPMGGVKESGLGRRHGREGITKFCEQQTIVVDRFGGAKELFWYPSSPKLKGSSRARSNVLFRSGLAGKLAADVVMRCSRRARDMIAQRAALRCGQQRLRAADLAAIQHLGFGELRRDPPLPSARRSPSRVA